MEITDTTGTEFEILPIIAERIPDSIKAHPEYSFEKTYRYLERFVADITNTIIINQANSPSWVTTTLPDIPNSRTSQIAKAYDKYNFGYCTDVVAATRLQVVLQASLYLTSPEDFWEANKEKIKRSKESYVDWADDECVWGYCHKYMVRQLPEYLSSGELKGKTYLTLLNEFLTPPTDEDFTNYSLVGPDYFVIVNHLINEVVDAIEAIEVKASTPAVISDIRFLLMHEAKYHMGPRDPKAEFLRPLYAKYVELNTDRSYGPNEPLSAEEVSDVLEIFHKEKNIGTVWVGVIDKTQSIVRLSWTSKETGEDDTVTEEKHSIIIAWDDPAIVMIVNAFMERAKDVLAPDAYVKNFKKAYPGVLK